jgi:XTP/dITP diphosphohydrolase
MIKQLVLASNNSGKIQEFSKIFASVGIEIIPQGKLNVPEIDEPYFTFVENALHKARHCSLITKLPALADDSGVCVNALNGRPGILSARYAGFPKNDYNNNMKLVEELHSYKDKSAYYYCVLVMVRSHEDPQPIIADGSLSGEIIETPNGDNGFGYDPHFYLPKLRRTAGKLSAEEKNNISHRAQALQKLLQHEIFIRK